MDDLNQECIICTLNLVVAPVSDIFDVVGETAVVATGTKLPAHPPHPCKIEDIEAVAVIKPCNHYLHNHCLREWSQIANTCPFCRQTFNLVEVHDAVGGTIISSYTVKDKKQITTLDPSTGLQEEDDEDAGYPCPICNESNNPDVLILCDACDANYHTYCLGLNDIPRGDWFCMECAEIGACSTFEEATEAPQIEPSSRRRAPRSQATSGRTRQRLRHYGWSGPWNQIGHRIHGATGLDIDFSEDEDVSSWRRLGQNPHRGVSHQNVWRVRMNIARRQGADWTSPTFLPSAPTPVESVEESMAWGDFEKAKEIDTNNPKAKKRKPKLITASSSTSSLSNPPESQTQRKLKRPRTRRVIDQPESSSSSSSSSAPIASLPDHSQLTQSGSPSDQICIDPCDEPSFLSSLLREVNMASSLEDGRLVPPTVVNPPARAISPSVDYPTPTMTSPTSSSHRNRSIMSTTPPARIKNRSISPLPLSSRIEPVFFPAEYSPNRIQTATHQEMPKKYPQLELHQPRPSRKSQITESSNDDYFPAREDSPTSNISLARATLSWEIKRDISKMVKSALAPHWRSAQISKEQYGSINRDVSRKLYEILADNNFDEKERSLCEKIAIAEVATALNSL